MINTDDWPFNKATYLANDLNIRVLGTYGYAVNRGSTQDALEQVLRQFKTVSTALFGYWVLLGTGYLCVLAKTKATGYLLVRFKP